MEEKRIQERYVAWKAGAKIPSCLVNLINEIERDVDELRKAAAASGADVDADVSFLDGAIHGILVANQMLRATLHGDIQE